MGVCNSMWFGGFPWFPWTLIFTSSIQLIFPWETKIGVTFNGHTCISCISIVSLKFCYSISSILSLPSFRTYSLQVSSEIPWLIRQLETRWMLKAANVLHGLRTDWLTSATSAVEKTWFQKEACTKKKQVLETLHRTKKRLEHRGSGRTAFKQARG